MARKMQQKYFEEKRKFSIEALGIAIAKAEEAKRLIEAARYEMPNLIDPKEIHDLALVAQLQVRSAMRDFEKTRWADAITELEFEDWLRHHGHFDLLQA